MNAPPPVIRLALVGYSPEIDPLLQVIAVAPEYRLTSVYELGISSPTVLRLHPAAATTEPWETLLHKTAADAVLFAGIPDVDRNEEILRRLAQCGIPLLILHPACEMVLGFELLMIQRDTQGIMQPYFPGMFNPIWQAHLPFAEKTPTVDSDRSSTIATSPDAAHVAIGALTECVIDRLDADGDRNHVLRLFSRDVLLLPAWIDPIRKISALGPTNTVEAYTQLSIQMATQAGTLVRWNYRTDPRATTSIRWVLHGTDGRLELECSVDGGPIAWRRISLADRPGGNSLAGESGVAAESPREVLDRFRATIAGQYGLSTWEQACRALELKDYVPVSCRRGKTIELHLDDVSEEKTFKAMMAAGGCLIILLVLMVLPLIGAADALLFAGSEKGVWDDGILAWIGPRRWPVYLAIGLLAFLALQFLRLVFPSAGQADETSP